MTYRDDYILELKNRALQAYNGIPVRIREVEVAEVKKGYMHLEEYPMFLDPVNRLVEMGELDFDSKSTLENIVDLLRK